MLGMWLGVFGVVGAQVFAAPPLHERLIATSYERWTQPRPKASHDDEVVVAIMHFGRAHNLRLVHDSRLDQAAETLLSWAHNHAGEALAIGPLQTEVWQTGDTDGNLAALALRASPKDPIGLSLQKALAQALPQLAANRFGLAQQGDTVVVAFATHWMHLAPTPARVACGQRIRIAGQNLDDRIQTLTLAIARPDGTLIHARPPLINAAFVEAVDVGDVQGVLDVQVLIDRGQGPEIAAQYPVGVGQSPWPAPGAQGILAGPPRSQSGASSHLGHHASLDTAQLAQAKQALVALVWGLRKSHGLSLPDAAPRLMTVAQRHGDDMATHHFFAHVSPHTGDVTQRLLALHQPYIRVVENIAATETLDAGFAQWTHSPSHRANLLDPSVTHMGVGLAQGDAPDDILMVLVMAHLP